MTEITAHEQAEFDHQHDIADERLTAVLDDIPDDVDSLGVLYSLWVIVTHMLAGSGWTAEELSRDVQHHVALATSTGGMQ